MKTKPMAHQLAGRERLRENPRTRKHFAMAAEQGTGKTWMLLDDMEFNFGRSFINAGVVLAPKGVHTNWVRREIPTHCEMDVRSEYWISGAGVGHTKRLKELLKPTRKDQFTFLAMNIDALNTKPGRDYLRQFLQAYDAVLDLDESSRVKNPQAARTKAAIEAGALARQRRIASGTMITGGPQDAFAQFEFLLPKGGLLGTRSYRAFVSEYAQVLPPENGIIQGYIARNRNKLARFATGTDVFGQPVYDMEAMAKVLPQIVATDPIGRPIYRNLDKLSRIMSPYTYRVTKKECLDLPDKIYKTLYYELTPEQKRVYEKLKHELVYERDNGEIDRFTSMTKLIKLRQAVSGFIMLDGEAHGLVPDHPRLQLFKDCLEDVEGQFIVWASFREEIAQVCATLKEQGISFVEYHGGTKDADREAAVDDFQAGKARAFVGHQQAGGIGLTLTAAETTIYYSCDFSLELRLQSEDRNHRIGTKNNVLYIDLAALGTVDEHIARALQTKEEVATAIYTGL